MEGACKPSAASPLGNDPVNTGYSLAGQFCVIPLRHLKQCGSVSVYACVVGAGGAGKKC